MSINGQGNFDRIRRVEAIDANQKFDDQQDERKRRKVNYQGRVWEEGEEDLPLHPQSSVHTAKKETAYADPVILQKTEKLYHSYTTLEDKIAGIFFFETEAYYDEQVQKTLEFLIQGRKIGGLLFTKGEYKRQHYLIERYQELAQIPLLMGNDFTHGLNYYFWGDSSKKWGVEMMNAKYFSDLGRAVVSQNRNLGVHFQLTERRGKECCIDFPLSEEFLKAFRKGMRDARGIISFFGHEHKKFATISFERPHAPPLFSSGEIREVFSLKTLTFLDMTGLSFDECKERLVSAFQNNTYDAFLFSVSQSELIDFVTLCVKEGVIPEKEIEKRLTKILALNVKSR